jgi:hypothetical protein
VANAALVSPVRPSKKYLKRLCELHAIHQNMVLRNPGPKLALDNVIETLGGIILIF